MIRSFVLAFVAMFMFGSGMAFAQTELVPLGDLSSPSVIGGWKMSPTDNATFTKNVVGSRTETGPATVTSTQELVAPATTESSRDYSGLATWCPMISTMNGGKTYPTNVNADCVPQAIAPTGGTGGPAIFRTVTTTTPGETLTFTTCITNSKTLGAVVGGSVEVTTNPSTSRDGSC